MFFSTSLLNRSSEKVHFAYLNLFQLHFLFNVFWICRLKLLLKKLIFYFFFPVRTKNLLVVRVALLYVFFLLIVWISDWSVLIVQLLKCYPHILPSSVTALSLLWGHRGCCWSQSQLSGRVLPGQVASLSQGYWSVMLNKFEMKICLDLCCGLSLRRDGGSQRQTSWKQLL